jgi:hypothetical protein
MIDQNQPLDPYEAVLADLRAQREKIDQTIALISSLRGIKSSTGNAGGTSSAAGSGASVVEDSGSMFLSMSIPDAVLKLLSLRKRKMTNSEILAELKAGGLELTSQDPLNVIGSVLSRRFHAVGDIVRVDRGTWGLKAWYPGRNFKGKATNGDKSEEFGARTGGADVDNSDLGAGLEDHDDGQGKDVFERPG